MTMRHPLRALLIAPNDDVRRAIERGEKTSPSARAAAITVRGRS